MSVPRFLPIRAADSVIIANEVPRRTRSTDPPRSRCHGPRGTARAGTMALTLSPVAASVVRCPLRHAALIFSTLSAGPLLVLRSSALGAGETAHDFPLGKRGETEHWFATVQYKCTGPLYSTNVQRCRPARRRLGIMNLPVVNLNGRSILNRFNQFISYGLLLHIIFFIIGYTVATEVVYLSRVGKVLSKE